ncbi:hypothetical protein NADE_002635 [Nannochloris sp. 'desiccata']|nr:hypothetical protein NADE_002635 [Chlorella desiccata (nom. nud.)]
MALSTPQPSQKYSLATSLLALKPLASPTRHFSPVIYIPATCRHRHCLSILPSAALPAQHLTVLADYVPKFPRLFDTPVKDFIAPDAPLLPGFNADDMTRIFLPDLINPSNIYTLLLFISCAAAFVYLELGALFNDFVQEKDFEKLEEQFLEGQRKDRPENKNIEIRGNDDAGGLSHEEMAYKERKRGLGWLAFITAAAIWCTGILNKLNAFQP